MLSNQSQIPIQQQPVTASKSTSKSVVASKKEYETLWQAFFVFISVVSAILFNKAYLYQTQQVFAAYRKGDIWTLLGYGLPFAIVFGIIDNLIHKYFDPLCDKYYINHQKFPDPQIRRKRCFTLVKWAYSLFYYFFSSLSAYLILYNTDVLPVWLGGSGSCMNIYKDIPRMPNYSIGMQIFYVLQFGKHFSRAFGHCFLRAQGNFYQYALHHGLSTFLIMFSYLMNYWMVGVLVLFVHDISDFFLILSRAYREARNRRQWLLQIYYVSTFIVWIGSRIIVFCVCCIYPSIIGAFKQLYKSEINDEMRKTLLAPSYFMIFMLIMLQVLQIFWTYYIARSFLATSVSKQLATHNYD